MSNGGLRLIEKFFSRSFAQFRTYERRKNSRPGDQKKNRIIHVFIGYYSD